MRQPYYGGIQVISGSEIIFQHDSAIKQAADEVYAIIKNYLGEALLKEAKNEFNNRVGQRIVRESFRLEHDSSMEIELIPDGIILRFVITNNRFRFWVTTPDIKLLSLEIGASPHLDPGFEIHFDIGIEMQAVNVHTIDSIQLIHLPLEAKIDFEGTNITGKLAEAVVRVIDKAIAWIKNEDGFLKCIDKVSIELVEIKNGINKFLETSVIRNQELLIEMGIDESRNIQYGLIDDFLTLTHPHSSIGIAKRAAKQNPAGADNPPGKITGLQPKATESTREINKAPAPITYSNTKK